MDKMANKEAIIKFRIEVKRKISWKNICTRRNISLSEMIIDSVEKRLPNYERRKVLSYIEKQDNSFAKVENNINQIARIANSQKFLSKNDFDSFNLILKEILRLKQEQNKTFIQFYALLAK
ncbi:hypothetical protein IO89_17635 [Epilithonimonas lactis]|uniref:Plasmid mobilization relaxosome protein MobC n=2 Tax=Epilithonimonas lactis TaxID=421072 RepID=A0A085B778_9FLAO|nr:hypothetical protein IO89_17635 [Epilithonimonas lactis]